MDFTQKLMLVIEGFFIFLLILLYIERRYFYIFVFKNIKIMLLLLIVGGLIGFLIISLDPTKKKKN